MSRPPNGATRLLREITIQDFAETGADGIAALYNNIMEHTATVIICRKNPNVSGVDLVAKLRFESLRPTKIYAKRRRSDVKTPEGRNGQNDSDREQKDCIAHSLPPEDDEECYVGRTNS